MDQQAFSNVPASPQPHPAHPPGLVAVRERTLRQFVAPSPQPGAAIPANPPTVPVDGAPQGLPTPPAPTPARGLRDVRTVAALPRLLDYRIAVILLVTHQRPRLLPLPATLRRRRLPGPRITAPEMALHFVQCLRQRLCVPPAPWWTVTAAIAPLSRSTACSALYAIRVRPSFSRPMRASESTGCAHSSFDNFFRRLRS